MSAGRTAVVDASALIAVLLPEADSDEAREWLAGVDDLHAPELLVYEVASALRSRVLRGDLSADLARRHLDATVIAPMEMHDGRSLAPRALELALALGHSVYDCVYLALAIDLDCELVTGDRQFARIVRKAGLPDTVHLLGHQR